MLPDFRLEVFYSRWEFVARYNLSASDMESMAVTELLELASVEERERWEQLRLGYIPTFGTPELRAAVAQTYQAVSAEDVLAFAGAEEGIFCAMHAVLGAGDHAVVTVPNYQSMEEIPLGICEVSGVALRPDDGWQLDPDDMRRALRPNTRLIAVNFPNNPTGAVLTRDRFDALVQLAAERGIYLFSDEVYRGLERDETRRLPQAADVYERGLSLNVMSKAYGLPGLRVGWIACRDRAVLGRMERVKHYLSICNAGPSELLATIALRAAERVVGRSRDLIARNLPIISALFARHADLFDWTVPDGGCVGFPRYLHDQGVDELCRRVVESTGVLLLPGSVYESRLQPVPRDRFRVGYGRADLPEAVEKLEEYFDGRAEGRKGGRW